jgi:hypothetical protein
MDLDLDWAMARYAEQGGRCAVSGVLLEFPPTGQGPVPHPYAPSLDRVDPRLGYTKSNTRLVAVALNAGLGSWGEAVYRRIAESYIALRWLAAHQRQR